MLPRAKAVPAALLSAAALLAGCSGGQPDDAAAIPPAGAPSSASAGASPGAAGASGASGAAPVSYAPQAQRLGVEVVARHPWDDSTFTQGLEIDRDGSLLVGTGQYGTSAVWRVREWAAGSPPEDHHDLPPELFGEGLTRAGDVVWQLTWKEGVAIARDADTLAETRRASYEGEGWGLCAQDGRLVMSDGTDTLTFRDPATFAATGTIAVTSGETPVGSLNELECVDGPRGPEVWANRWLTNDIVRIDPATGDVTGYADASALAEALPAEARRKADVLNGIAHIPGTDRYLLAGKLWPTLYEVRFTDAD